jgi:glycine cleavage system H lipoate-binding protein
MQCPFLREAHVKYCRSSSFRKMIVETAASAADEKCSTPAYRDCSAYRAGWHEQAEDVRCPHLQQILVQYCEASPLRKFIPYNESPLSRCRNESFRYCQLYAQLMNAGENAGALEDCSTVRTPDGLFYSPNHMWLDPGEDGTFHIGVDAFAVRAVGAVEKISFPTLSGVRRPSVVLRTSAADVQLVFPNNVLITGTNVYLRANPAKLFEDPYTVGWLFRAEEVPGSPITAGLIRGSGVAPWMAREVDALTRLVHERLSASGQAADGGVFATGILGYLEREEALRVINNYFSPHAKWTDHK